MSIRMLPLKTTFERFRRLVHDPGIELHKDVDLVIEGADTELDKTLNDQLNDPLVHLIRNSMDHGIETSQAHGRDRASSGFESSRRKARRIVDEPAGGGDSGNPSCSSEEVRQARVS